MDRKTDFMLLRKAEVYFFDLDGCIYHTDQPASGAKELLERLRSDGKRVGFITNNSRDMAVELAEKIQHMGLRIKPAEIFPATDVSGFYLKKRYGIQSVKVVGSKGLERSIEQWGHRIVDFAALEPVDVIVIGRDTEFTYEKLQQIVELEAAGARVVAVNPDEYHPGRGGKRVPETGALAAAIEAIIGKPLEYVGKPATTMFDFAMLHYWVKSQQCIMVGDNLYTDIEGGLRAEMRTIWIRGAGMNQSLSDSDLNAPKPNIIVDSMDELLALYRNGGA